MSNNYADVAAQYETRQGSMSRVIAERERLLAEANKIEHSHSSHDHGGVITDKQPKIPNFAEEREKNMR